MMKLLNQTGETVAEAGEIHYDEALRGWVCGDSIITDTDKVLRVSTGRVSPVEFMLLFTAAERVAIKAARATNPVIDDILDIVDDPRLTYVDLGLTSTQEAVGYLAQEGFIDEARIPVILSGVVQ